MDYYLKQLDRTPLLAEHKQVKAILKAQGGDRVALDLVVSSNLRLVIYVAKRYGHCCSAGLGFADLVQEGNIGLMRAVKMFDPDYGTRFSTYAVWWIKQNIRRAIIDQHDAVRVPAYAQQQCVDYDIETAPTRATRDALRAKTILSLDALDTYDIPVTEDTAFEDEEERTYRINACKNALRVLSQQERYIIKHRFADKKMTLKALGERLGLSRERIRQIERDALLAMRIYLTRATRPLARPA